MNVILKSHPVLLILLAGVPLGLGCSTSSSGPAAGGTTNAAGTTGSGGQFAAGGVAEGGGSIGSGGVATGGTSATGGIAATGGVGGQGAGPAGGVSRTGGMPGTGGVSKTGGILATGGIPATGGVPVSGGVTTTGGRGATGGIPDTGGVLATGGIGVDGGSTAKGGILATGGIGVDGGSSGKGGATGGKTATGGIGVDGGATATGGTNVAGGVTATGGTTPTGGVSGDAGVPPTGWVTIHNDFFWYDTDGNLINVRSGALRKFGDLYYWYGGAPNDHNQTCYSSPDLVHWTYKGIVLTTTGDANRMDILYNATTKQYVIFLKYIGNGAYFGIATGSTPDGQFTFKSQTLVDGFVIGDMSMFQDDDGTAYLAYVWWGTGTNKAHGIYRLSADYLTLDTRMFLWNEGSREAPHIFKRNGTYFYGVSETNGIQPSPTRYYTATNLAGPWTAPVIMSTPGSSTTYETQCDFVLPFAGTQDTVYLFDADRWIPTGGFQGDYLWLPLEFDTTGFPSMSYYQDWDFNLAAGTWRAFDRSRDLALGKTATASSESAGNPAASVTKSTTYQNYTATRWASAAGDTQSIMVDLGAATEVNRVILKWYTDYGKAFKIQVSTDSTTWTDVYSTTTGASYSVTDVSFAKTSARYVRMSGTQSGTKNGYSLFAFMVLNDP
jgi:hypothetical protein